MTKKIKRFQEGGLTPIRINHGPESVEMSKNLGAGLNPYRSPYGGSGDASDSLKQVYAGAQGINHALGTIKDVVGGGGGVLDDMRATLGSRATSQPQMELYKQFKKGGKIVSASKRADGIAKRGKTRGKMV